LEQMFVAGNFKAWCFRVSWPNQKKTLEKTTTLW
jgi:hypothetical protein